MKAVRKPLSTEAQGFLPTPVPLDLAPDKSRIRPGLSAPWQVTDVRLDVEATEIHVHVDHPEGCRWTCPKCSRELGCYDHAPERQWRHLNTCQFHTLVHARIPRVECPEHGVVQVKVPWAEPHGRFTLLMERFVIDVLQACQTVKGACALVGISWDQAWHV